MYSDDFNRPTTEQAFRQAARQREKLIKELKVAAMELEQKDPEKFDKFARFLEMQKQKHPPLTPS